MTSLTLMETDVFCLNKMLRQCVGCYTGRQNVYRQGFHEHFFSFLDLSSVYRWPACWISLSYLQWLSGGIMCQNLSPATENQLNRRFVVLHLECGESNGSFHIPVFSKGRSGRIKLTHERCWGLKMTKSVYILTALCFCSARGCIRWFTSINTANG